MKNKSNEKQQQQQYDAIYSLCDFPVAQAPKTD